MMESTLLQPPSHRARRTASICALLLFAAGAGGLFLLVHTKPQHEGGTPRAPSRFVRYLAVKKRPHQIVVSGYGISKAGEEWDAISEVKGKAVFVDAGFEAGVIMPQGQLLLRLDPRDYELAIQQIEAQVRGRGQELKEIEQQSRNLVEPIRLSERQVALAEKDFKRQKDLEGTDAFMEAALDKAQRNSRSVPFKSSASKTMWRSSRGAWRMASRWLCPIWRRPRRGCP